MAYDSKGNLTSVTSTGLSADTATYAEGNLIQSATPGKGTYSYTYDTTYPHRLTKVTLSGMGLSQGYTYDSKGNVTATVLESSTVGTKKLQSSASYSSDGNRMVSVTDGNGSTTSYAYGTLLSQMLGVPTVTTDPKGDQVQSTYDSFGRLMGAGVYDVEGSTSTKAGEVSYAYQNFLISQIQRSSGVNAFQTYHFAYDVFGNVTSLKVGNKTLAGYTYGPGNGPLLTLSYGNGDSVSYTYDKYGRMATESHDTGNLSYTYNGEGLLYGVTENNTKANNTSQYLYTYDSLNRLLYSERLDDGILSHRVSNRYNDKNQLTAQGVQMAGFSYSQGYIYHSGDGSLTQMTIDLESTTGTDHTLSLSYNHLREVVMQNDWRITNQMSYLYRVRIKRATFKAVPTNDHEHCEFCWDKFGESEGLLKSGYSTLDGYHWICEECFRDGRADKKWDYMTPEVS